MAGARDPDQRYFEVFEHTHDGVFLIGVTPEGRFRVAGFNPAEERLTGISNATAAGRYVEDFLSPETAAMVSRNYRRCVETAGALTYDEELDLPSGQRHFSTTLVPVLDPNGRVHRIIGVAHDVTEEKVANAALRASEERFRQLAENIREVFWMTDVSKSQILYVSPAYETIWGRTCESLYESPRSWLEAVHPEDRELAGVMLRKQRKEHADATYRIRRPDGTERWIRDRSFPVRNHQGEVQRVVGIAEDITQLVENQERLRQSQKLEAVGQLAGGVAHDFNNLLSVILTYADLLLDKLGSTDPLRGDLEEVRKAGQRATALTRHLLAFSRNQVLQPTLLELGQTVATMEKMLRRILSEDIELHLQCAPGSGHVYADPGQVEQVILNLVVNARDAMPDGGILTIAVSRVKLQPSQAERIGAAPGSYVMLAVRDTGTGMDAATKERIFEPFFTTKETGKGTGLGLSTVFGIVQQSGATMRVESTPGRGATFEIYFPRVQPPEATRSSPPAANARREGTETILLTEDDDQVRSVVGAILRRYGYHVLEAQNAGEALLICEQHKAPIHLLLTDVVMPRMSGTQLAQRLAPLRPDMKVLYMTGYADESVVNRGVLTTGISLVQKPITPEALTRRVREALS